MYSGDLVIWCCSLKLNSDFLEFRTSFHSGKKQSKLEIFSLFYLIGIGTFWPPFNFGNTFPLSILLSQSPAKKCILVCIDSSFASSVHPLVLQVSLICSAGAALIVDHSPLMRDRDLPWSFQTSMFVLKLLRKSISVVQSESLWQVPPYTW
jgi:hypothetical protein